MSVCLSTVYVSGVCVCDFVYVCVFAILDRFHFFGYVGWGCGGEAETATFFVSIVKCFLLS